LSGSSRRRDLPAGTRAGEFIERVWKWKEKSGGTILNS